MVDFATTAATDRVLQLETGLAKLSARLDTEIARHEARARRLQFWDTTWQVLVTMLVVIAPVVVTLQAASLAVTAIWAIVAVTAASAAVLLQRTLDFRQRFVIARTVHGRLNVLRRRIEYDLSDLPQTQQEYHGALRGRLERLVEGYVDIVGEHARAELQAIWHIDGLS